MNERIKQLAKEAGFMPDNFISRWDQEFQKLFELIVRECVLQCVHNEDMDLIEKHFGVEE